MKLFYFEATQSLRTEGYVIATDEESARSDAIELSDTGDRSIWEPEFGVDIYLHEHDPERIPKDAYIWSGGPSGKEVNPAQVREILAEHPERLPEIPGQERMAL